MKRIGPDGLTNQQRYALRHRDRLKKEQQEKYLANKEAINLKCRLYNKNNREKINANKRKYEAKRREAMKNDPNILLKEMPLQIKRALRSRLTEAVRRINHRKTNSTIHLLGCSFEEFRIYLESKFTKNMTWQNYGVKGWHMDHIVPCAKFDLTDPEQQKKCFHYSNIQPLWWYDNLRKGKKIV